MATPEFLRESLAHFKQQKQRLIDDLRSIDTTIRQLQIEIGETPEAHPSPEFTPVIEMARVPTPGKGVGYNPRPDEFYSMSQGEAAKTYLTKIGHAISIDEILNGLRSGGCKVGGVDPKKTLYVSLTSNSREFVAIGNGIIGLRSFYPNMPKLGRPKAEAVRRGTAKRGKKGQKRKSSGAALSQVPHTKLLVAGDIKTAVRAILADNVARTPDVLVKAVEDRLGRPVKKIAVYGLLRKKDFEQVGDKYRLRPQVEEHVVVQ